MTDQKPTINCSVLYRTDGRNGLIYDLPAIITCTKDSHLGEYPAAWDIHREGWPDGIIPGDKPDRCNGLTIEVTAGHGIIHKSHLPECPVHCSQKNPLPIPESDTHVHLTVFTPGGMGTIIGEWPSNHLPVSSKEFVGAKKMTPGSGTYVEWNVPFHDDISRDADPRTWRWPVIVK